MLNINMVLPVILNEAINRSNCITRRPNRIVLQIYNHAFDQRPFRKGTGYAPIPAFTDYQNNPVASLYRNQLISRKVRVSRLIS